jgi:hypothetical protein
MLAGMSSCAWAVLEQHRDRGWHIIDDNATTLPEPLELADDTDRTVGRAVGPGDFALPPLVG